MITNQPRDFLNSDFKVRDQMQSLRLLESSNMELQENIFANNSALSEDDDKNSGSLMMAGMGDLSQ